MTGDRKARRESVCVVASKVCNRRRRPVTIRPGKEMKSSKRKESHENQRTEQPREKDSLARSYKMQSRLVFGGGSLAKKEQEEETFR